MNYHGMCSMLSWSMQTKTVMGVLTTTSLKAWYVICIYYPHMSIGRVWIYRLLFVCMFFVGVYGYGFLRQG